MRKKLIRLIQQEADNAHAGLSSGIVIKINSLQDKEMIDELYHASQAGVPIKMIIRGMCCLRPGREGLSENIQVISIVGDFLEHSRLYYFHNNGDPKIYCGSADSMVRSFDRRMESLFLIKDHDLRQQAIKILEYNLADNVNSYEMLEDGSYMPKQLDGQAAFSVHKEFFNMAENWDVEANLFG
jgi:polyphosphate kinase